MDFLGVPALSQKAPARVILAFRKQGRGHVACHHAFTTVKAMGIFSEIVAHIGQ